MSRKRGLNLQNGLARYLQSCGWPDAESAGAGRPGTDILGMPLVAWEVKTAREFRPLEFVRQAKSHIVPRPCCKHPGTGLCMCDCHDVDDVHVVVYWPVGVGEGSVQSTLSILPTGVLVRLLKEAGY